MGCINSKTAQSMAAASPVLDYSVRIPRPLPILGNSSAIRSRNSSGLSGSFHFELKHNTNNVLKDHYHGSNKHRKNSSVIEEMICKDQNGNNQLKKLTKNGSFRGPIDINLGFSYRSVEAEQVAAGWPSWLSTVSAEAIHGWVPLRADAFEKLDKIGQGTYSSVFLAREVATGKMVALKKVRFDNFQRESVRFMTREILILRQLDHPNIMKLEGIITSRLSISIYLVFEYMEHDLAGLSSSPDIIFSEAQVKCYMKQLLCGLEHCHLRGIMHRDIKASNILVNNEGVLKLADFGLANILSPENRDQLTSRVVTLWYRPPELLMGSTSYGVSVDLWSVGCVFGELLIGKPLLKGRTEVEQLHKIFKLCGSPPEEYWNQSDLPNRMMFKPRHCYESSLRKRCHDFPATTVDLLETFLSIEPEKRRTASSALESEYFKTMPYACDPSSLPKYAPNKEMDAKYREEAQRKRVGSKMQEQAMSRKPRKVHRTLQQQNSFNKLRQNEEVKDNNIANKTNYINGQINKGQVYSLKETSSSFDIAFDTSQLTKGDSAFTGPEPVTKPNGFAWTKRENENVASTLSYDQSIISSEDSALDSTRFDFANNSLGEAVAKYAVQKQQTQIDLPECLSSTNMQCPFDYSTTKAAILLRNNLSMDYSKQREKIEFSGPVLSQSNEDLTVIEAVLQRNEKHIRQATRRSKLDSEANILI